MPDIVDREQELIDLLASEWDPTQVRGFNVNETDPADESFLPLEDSIENVGTTYPSITITYSNETSPGSSGYSFVNTNGPGSNNQGSMIATVRAEADPDGNKSYTGDIATYNKVYADTIAKEILHHIREIVRANPNGGTSNFDVLGTDKGAEAPDDYSSDPAVMVEQANILFSWIEKPD
jgi:hypothetical protein